MLTDFQLTSSDDGEFIFNSGIFEKLMFDLVGSQYRHILEFSQVGYRKENHVVYPNKIFEDISLEQIRDKLDPNQIPRFKDMAQV